MDKSGIEMAIEIGLKQCRVDDDAPIPLIRESDLHHITHMVKTEVTTNLLNILPNDCWVLKSSEFRCVELIGGSFNSGAWTFDMCCLPCQIRFFLGVE